MYPCMTIQRPCTPDSAVNLTPVNPILTPANIPKDAFNPTINCSSFSVPVEVCAWNTPIATVKAVKDQDGEYVGDMKIRIPPSLDGAPGTDGHAVSIDPFDGNGIIHQFQNLKNNKDGTFSASGYAYSRLNGTGFGDDKRYRKGTTAIGANSLLGLITKTDIADGKTEFDYALAMSLCASGLSKSSVWPATAIDSDVSQNSGIVPYGARLMLAKMPGGMSNKTVTRSANTLIKRGGIVRDRNTGCPFALYAQQGIDLSKYTADGDFAADMELIRQNLMICTCESFFLDGNNNIWAPEGQCIISLRGAWRSIDGGPPVDGFRMAPLSGSLTFSGKAINYDNRMILPENMPVAGDKLRLRVYVSDPLATTTFNPQNGMSTITRIGSYSQDIVWGSGKTALYFSASSKIQCSLQLSLVFI